jgi:hypothetical protein
MDECSGLTGRPEPAVNVPGVRSSTDIVVVERRGSAPNAYEHPDRKHHSRPIRSRAMGVALHAPRQCSLQIGWQCGRARQRRACTQAGAQAAEATRARESSIAAIAIGGGRGSELRVVEGSRPAELVEPQGHGSNG